MLQNQPSPTPGVRPGLFTIQVAGTDLKFQELKIADPAPTGRQIVEALKVHPIEDYVVLQWLPSGRLERISLSETADLRQPGAERFIVARGDGVQYDFTLDGQDQEWPEPIISRETLLALAGQNPALFAVWQEFKGKDKEVLAGHPANLAVKGVERFYTVMDKTTEGSDGRVAHP